jgi:hypothetical protein
MMQNLISFYFWNQKLYFKIESYFDQIWGKDGFRPLLLPASVAPLQQPWWCWNSEKTFYIFLTKTLWSLKKNHEWIWKEQLLIKNFKGLFMEIIPWISLRLLITHNFLPCFFVCTPFASMNNIFSHITN